MCSLFSSNLFPKNFPLTIFVLIIFLSSCDKLPHQSQVLLSNNPAPFPPVVLWAWERPENLEFINSNKYAVAYLAQTLTLQNDTVIFRPRHQPLKVKPETKMIAVTRIESDKSTGQSTALSVAQKEQLLAFILKTREMKNVSAIQIDFDATVSEREFYRNLLTELREKLPAEVPLSITALASFCIGDRWLSELPVDEAVPMIFRMGADDQKIKGFLANGHDFAEPLCQYSYGIAIDEPVSIKFEKSRRVYVFNNHSWKLSDIEKIESLGIE